MSFLISAGANINTKDNQGRNPLHWAATKGKHFLVRDDDYVNVIKLLVLHGADVHAKDEDGKTPLDAAKKTKNTAAVKYLTGL